jgi:hypothetical protein
LDPFHYSLSPTHLPTLETRNYSRSTVNSYEQQTNAHYSFIADTAAPRPRSIARASPTLLPDAGASERPPLANDPATHHTATKEKGHGLLLPKNHDHGLFLVFQSPADREVGRRRPQWTPRLSATAGYRNEYFYTPRAYPQENSVCRNRSHAGI